MKVNCEEIKYPSWVNQEHELTTICNEFFDKDRPEIVKFSYGVKRVITDHNIKHTMFIDIVVKEDDEVIGTPFHFEAENRNELFVQLYKRFNP